MSWKKLTIAMLTLCWAHSVGVVAGITSDEEESNKLVIYVNQGQGDDCHPPYHVFEMFKVHQGATRLPSDLVCHQYPFQNQHIPALVTSASRNAAGRVHISICNLHPNEESRLACLLEDYAPKHVTGRFLTAEKMTDHNTFENPNVVRPVSFGAAKVNGNLIMASIPAK